MTIESKKSENSNPAEQKQIQGWNPVILGAVITAVATILVAFITVLFQFPPFIELFQGAPTPTATASPIATSTDTPLPVLAVNTNTPEFATMPAATGISVVPPDLTETASLPSGMEVHLYADKTTGRLPISVKFDARDSLLRASKGIEYSCRGGACYYTWKVYNNGQQIGKSESNSNGTFKYTFRERGTYVVTVYVCRGQDRVDCGGSGTMIVVTK